MDISKYISELLYEYDCVIIPNFGGFLTKYSSSKINPVNNYFFPPSKIIVFNANIKNNDGLVANYISNTKNISFVQANEQIQIFVKELNKELKDGKHIELPKIGTLYLDIENNLQFAPDTSVNYLNDSFGLTSFHSPLVERQNIQQKFEKKFINKQTAYQQKKYSLNSKLAVAASILLLIGITLYIKFNKNIFDNINTNYTNIVSYFKSYENVVPRESLKIKANKNNNTNTLKSVNTTNIFNPYKNQNQTNSSDVYLTKIPYSDTKVNDNNTKMTEANKSIKSNSNIINHTEIQKKYYIIGGCFGVSKNAENFLSYLKNKGFDAHFIGKTKSGLQRVAYCYYDNKKQAIIKLAIIKSENNPSAWIYRNSGAVPRI